MKRHNTIRICGPFHFALYKCAVHVVVVVLLLLLLLSDLPVSLLHTSSSSTHLANAGVTVSVRNFVQMFLSLFSLVLGRIAVLRRCSATLCYRWSNVVCRSVRRLVCLSVGLSQS